MFSSSSRSIFGLTNKFLNCLYRAFFTRKNFHGYSWWSLTGKSRKEETKNYVEFISGLKNGRSDRLRLTSDRLRSCEKNVYLQSGS